MGCASPSLGTFRATAVILSDGESGPPALHLWELTLSEWEWTVMN